MADSLFAKVREERRSIRTLTVKVRYNDMAEDQVSESVLEPTDLETDVYGRLHQMLRQAWKRRVSLRLVSLKLSNTYAGRFRSELPLEISAQRQDSRARVALVIDELRKTLGPSVILRGHDFLLRHGPREPLSMAEAGREPKKPRLQIIVRPRATSYVALRCHSYYSFLDSTLSPAAIVQLAKQHDLTAVALTDTGNLHGLSNLPSGAGSGIADCRRRAARGDESTTVYAMNATGYLNLCRLLREKAEGRMKNEETAVAARQRAPITSAFTSSFCLLEGLSGEFGLDISRIVSRPLLSRSDTARGDRRLPVGSLRQA
jgi:hypothetical protein